MLHSMCLGLQQRNCYGSRRKCVNSCVTKYLSANKEIQQVFAEDQASILTTGAVREV